MCYIFSLTFKYKFLDRKYKHISGREHDWKRLVKTQMLSSVEHFNRPTHFLLMHYPLLSILFLYGKRKWRSSFFLGWKETLLCSACLPFLFVLPFQRTFEINRLHLFVHKTLHYLQLIMNLSVPKGNISLSLNIKAKLAQRAAHHREKWMEEARLKPKAWSSQ